MDYINAEKSYERVAALFNGSISGCLHNGLSNGGAGIGEALLKGVIVLGSIGAVEWLAHAPLPDTLVKTSIQQHHASGYYHSWQ